MNILLKTDAGDLQELDIYSLDGLKTLSELRVKSSFYHRVMYEPTWLGVPIIQYPNDIVMTQELIWKVRPDTIIETGVAHGGAAILYASILELLGKGKVIGVDVEIRKHNSLAINSHPMSRRIHLIEGSSVDADVVADVETLVSGDVMVMLDSNHSTEHVFTEMEIYSRFISPGGYLVVMDGVQKMLSDSASGKKEWQNDNPLDAIQEFLKKNPGWEVDNYYTRTHITCNPSGFLRRKMQ